MGNDYARNHYVPQFLLREWHSGPDCKLTLFERQYAGRLTAKRSSANGAAFGWNIYTTKDLRSGEREVKIERDFFGPHIDDPGSVVHKIMLSGGREAMTEEDNGHWAQFLVAQYMRVPRTMRAIEVMARKALDEQLDADPDYARQAGLTTTLDTREWVQQFLPQAYDQLSRGGLPAYIQQPRLYDEMLQGRWDIRTVSPGCPFTLLIGDHPIIYRGSLESRFVVALPLSPYKMFLYTERGGATRRDWLGLSDEDFVKRANRESLTFASRYVMARDESQRRFIDRHLRQVPDA